MLSSTVMVWALSGRRLADGTRNRDCMMQIQNARYSPIITTFGQIYLSLFPIVVGGEGKVGSEVFGRWVTCRR